MRDFTFEILNLLFKTLLEKEYSFIPYKDYSGLNTGRIIILRHDVDKLPYNSLKFAELQSRLGIRGTYFFRIVNESFDVDIIKKISDLNHEIGYHYEDLTLAKGDFEKAYELFLFNLEKIRKYYPVKTICMHGSPLSKWDNKDLWEKYDYRESGIISEPYFDLDFNEIFYITDTGRRWDGGSVSVRDKVKSSFIQKYRTTPDIIRAVEENSFPERSMFTFHPQWWSEGMASRLSDLI